MAGVNPVELAPALEQLRALDSPNLDLAAPPERLSGGFWAEMWVLSVLNHGPTVPDRVVLRLPPDADLATWETIVQRGVADQGYPTPHIIAAAPATPSNRFWSVMEHAAGQPLLSDLSGMKALGRLPTLARSLPDRLADVTARLHALDASRLEHPPLQAPNAIRPVIHTAARALARRFIRSYNAAAAHPVDAAQLQWHTRLHTARVLNECASWRAAGTIDERRGHPFVMMEPALRNEIAHANASR